MPRVSERQQCLSLLRGLLQHYYKGQWIKELLPFLPELYEYLRNKRYWATRGPVLKVGSWSPQLLELRDDERFQRDARMDKRTFFGLLAAIEDYPEFDRRTTPGKKQLMVALQLSVYLAFLSTGGIGGSYYSISQRFGIGEGTVPKIVARVTSAILRLLPDYIRWPDSSERARISRRVECKSGFKGVCGIVDGTTFPFAFKPQQDPEDYFSRKSVYCMSAQVICDDNRVIRKILVGFPGSVHDMRQFKMMAVYQHPEHHFDRGQFLLGDAAYALSQNLVGPYKAPASESRRNKRFNYLLSTQRIAIEHTFGILKARFGRLHDGFRNVVRDREDSNRVVQVITAACVLHNFCVMHKDSYDCDYNPPTLDDYFNSQEREPAHPLHEDGIAESGKEWRKQIQRDVLAFNDP